MHRTMTVMWLVIVLLVGILSPSVYASNGDETAACLTTMFVLVGIVLFWGLPIVYVLRDSSKRGASTLAWGCLVFLFGVLGLLVYLVARPQGRLVKCPKCAREKPIRDPICPHCGERVV